MQVQRFFTYLVLVYHLQQVLGEELYIISPDSATQKKVYVTKNVGSTWTEKLMPSDSFTPHSGMCLSENTCILIGTNTRYFEVFRTTDAGLTWEKISRMQMPGTITGYSTNDNGIYCFDEDNCLFGFFEYVIRTTNGFKTAKPVLAIPMIEGSSVEVTSLECLRGGSNDTSKATCFVGVEGKYKGAIYRSRDGGKTWPDNYFTDYEVEDMSCVDSDDGDGMCAAAGTRGQFIYTKDKGDTWNTVKYTIADSVFIPFCRYSLYNCNLPKKVDSISCLSIDHCVIGFKGYDTKYEEKQNGALCSLKISSLSATVKCKRLFKTTKGLRVHCSSGSHCMAIAQQRYDSVYSLKFDAFIYKFDSVKRDWKTVDTPSDRYGNFQNMIGMAVKSHSITHKMALNVLALLTVFTVIVNQK